MSNQLTRVHLEGLPLSAVDSMITAAGQVVPSVSSTGLYQMTGGHPLYLTQHLRDLQEAGAEQALFASGPSADLIRIVETITRSRMARLDATTLQENVAVCATHGETFLSAVVERVREGYHTMRFSNGFMQCIGTPALSGPLNTRPG